MQKKYFKLPALNPEYINKQDYFFLFETNLFDKDNFTSYIFTQPVDIVKVRDFKGVGDAFNKIQHCSERYYIAGYLSYELGYYFERAVFKTKGKFDFPLINLCVFEKPVVFQHRTKKISFDIPGLFLKNERKEDFYISNLKFDYLKSEYTGKIKRIKEYIRCGATYQVNFTGKYKFDFFGSALALYQQLKLSQNVPYSAFCKFQDEYIISLSPELFFRIDGQCIYSRPMKGTCARGQDTREDKEKAQGLKNSPKERAENLMIVDLIRNDLGRIAETDTVKTKQLFNIEKYNRLFQMTSTVAGALKKGITYFDIFGNIFPGGSVTGAPKIRTMQIIKELEDGYRKLYCGALGFISPGNKAIFNLPIRTISIVDGKAEMGVGSGIVYDSIPKKEFAECSLKAEFLTDTIKGFKLIETILWQKGYKFLSNHLKRLKASALYFGFSYNQERMIFRLKIIEKKFNLENSYRLRLLLDKEGKIAVRYSKIKTVSLKQPKYVAISKYKIIPQDIFLYHKTTNRQLYDSEYTHYKSRGYYDVIFLNNRNEFTEGSISNIIIQKNNKFYTPPLSCGLLAGIFREHLLRKKMVTEKVLHSKDLIEADKVFLCNSVRGLREVKLKNVHSCSFI
ncbi:MAG: aminodeoxychorismate synthase component I [Candidatus Omnitrophica bacterium]|nr:aminodeoxychorismate synthase component I [Candidatus Omnitrophota bacterium]